MDSQRNNPGRNFSEQDKRFGRPGFEFSDMFNGFPPEFRGFGDRRGGRGRDFSAMNGMGYGPEGWGGFGGQRGRGFHDGGRGRGDWGSRGRGGGGGRGGFGPFGGSAHHWSPNDGSLSDTTSNDSNSDGQQRRKKVKTQEKGIKKDVKKCKKQWKRWHRMRHWMWSPIGNRSHCTLCWRQIEPLVDTDVLECGHLYHRKCFQEHIQQSVGSAGDSDNNQDVRCVQCNKQVDNKLVDEFRKRFSVETTDGEDISPQSSPAEEMDDLTVIN